jgi:multidrug efflux pump subunit AcrA (membrane-fusion protein)
MNKKIIWGIVGFVVLVVVLVGLKKAGVIGKEEGIEVTVEKVELRTLTESVNASGKVYPEIEVKVDELLIKRKDYYSQAKYTFGVPQESVQTFVNKASQLILTYGF